MGLKYRMNRKMKSFKSKCQDALLWLSTCWSPREQDEEEMGILDPAKVALDCKNGKYGSALKRTETLIPQYVD